MKHFLVHSLGIVNIFGMPCADLAVNLECEKQKKLNYSCLAPGSVQR